VLHSRRPATVTVGQSDRPCVSIENKVEGTGAKLVRRSAWSAFEARDEAVSCAIAEPNPVPSRTGNHSIHSRAVVLLSRSKIESPCISVFSDAGQRGKEQK
jgi:hypothetical protein